MTTGNFKSILISSITINREDRQRKELQDIDELAASIQENGLINPPLINPDNTLVAGERRLAAIKLLGWTHCPIQYAPDLEPDEIALLELEENIRRADLTWQDECLAVEKYHRLRSERDPMWNSTKTAAAMLTTDRHIQGRRQVARELLAGNERVITADKYSVARNITQRENDRRQNSAISEVESVAEDIATPEGEIKKEPAPPAIPLQNRDFIKWAAKYSGPKFNIIHCDFPYGIESDNQQQGSNVQVHGSYEDSVKVYEKLLDTLARCMDNVIANSAHLIFWFSMNRSLYESGNYTKTYNDLALMGWDVDPFPLIWHKSCNTGLLPDPNRGPRRTYETAFFASRGDRKIVRAVANSIAGPVNPDRIHMSEKPLTILRHFMRMVCDEYSIMLDPTCGSGNAVKVAEELGAAKVLGLEKDKEFWQKAKENYNI